MGGVIIPNESGSSQRNYKSQCLCTWPEGSGFPVPCPLSGLGFKRLHSWEFGPSEWRHLEKWSLDGDRLVGVFPSLVSLELPLCFLATMRWQFSSSMSFCHDLLLHHNQETMDPANHRWKSLKTGATATAARINTIAFHSTLTSHLFHRNESWWRDTLAEGDTVNPFYRWENSGSENNSKNNISHKTVP